MVPVDTPEAILAKDRVRNSTGVMMRLREKSPMVGIGGGVVYALLDLANAIRSVAPDDKTKHLLVAADALADALADGDIDGARLIAKQYVNERDGTVVDQYAAPLPDPTQTG